MPDYKIHSASDLLSKHFKVLEFFTSSKANELSLDNYPLDAKTYEVVVANLRELANAILEPLRRHYGLPITVSSGYRSPALNEAVGGSTTSQHSKGQAADLQIHGVSALEVARFVANSTLPFDQVIYEGRGTTIWTHISHDPVKPIQRHQALQSLKAGEYVPLDLS